MENKDELLFNEYESILDILGRDVDFFKNRSFLITGANGLIASYLVDFLLYLNNKYHLCIEISVIARSLKKLHDRFKSNLLNIKYIIHDMNYPFPEGMLDKKRFDYVIHAASNAHPVAFSKDPVGTMKTNLLGTINLLDKIDNTTKFLYLSSGEIYGNGIGDEIFSEKSIGRVDSKQFRSCYPESKRAAETLCVSYLEQYGIKTYIARLCYVYGPDITQDNTRADAQFLRNAINHENIVLKSDGLTKRSYCYVADAVCALLFILNKGKFDFYNIANPDSNITIKEYAETLAHIAGVNLSFSNPSVDEIKGFSRSTSSILDSSKLIELGWKPIYSIEQGLRNTFNLYNYTFYK